MSEHSLQPTRISVFLVDDHEIFRRGIRALLAEQRAEDPRLNHPRLSLLDAARPAWTRPTLVSRNALIRPHVSTRGRARQQGQGALG